MPKSLGELSPLVPRETENDAIKGSCFYNDDYTPIDESSKQLLQRRKLWMRLGQSSLVVAAVVVAYSFFKGSAAADHMNAAASLTMAAVKEDHLFAGLLADDKAFYFPTERSGESTPPVSGRRFLRALTADDDAAANIDWSFDWGKNKKDAAAIGEYYRSKGMALADYYRSKYDVSY